MKTGRETETKSERTRKTKKGDPRHKEDIKTPSCLGPVASSGGSTSLAKHSQLWL